MTPQQIEALKLALEALENSVDLVVEDAYNAEQLYGNYPSRQGKVGGLKVLADQHKKAITALEEVLAEHAMQEVQRLGQEIEPKIGCVNHDCDQCKAQPEQEPVVGTKTWFEDGKVITQYLHPSDIYIDPPQRTEQEPQDWKTPPKEDAPLVKWAKEQTIPPQRTEQEPDDIASIIACRNMLDAQPVPPKVNT
jgi:hypothetical protein